MDLSSLLDKIKPLDKDVMREVQKRLDNLTKPIGSLGRLEEIVIQLAGIKREMSPKVDKKNIIIMCADNGVVDEGISSCPKSVTATVTINFTKGITGVNVLSRHAGSDITVVDIGVDAELCENGIINRKIRKGTDNIAKGPAMTREEAYQAIITGIQTVEKLYQEGVQLLGTGEMGIGNTTTSSAVIAAYADAPIESIVGKGAGLTKEAYINKIDVVRRAIEVNRPNREDPIEVLTKVGGFDIGGLVGCFLGAAIYRIPILIDGIISGAAAILAIRLHPLVRDFIIPSHGSAEPGTSLMFQIIGMKPILDLEMRLGEGTGAALGFHIVDAAVAAYMQMGTFDDANIEKYVPLE